MSLIHLMTLCVICLGQPEPVATQPAAVDQSNVLTSVTPRSKSSLQRYSPEEATLLWVHVPKCGGTALARVAHAAATHHNVSIAWCYNSHGNPACSQPKGTLAFAQDLRAASYGSFLPEARSEAANAQGQAPSDTVRGRRAPEMVFGHGVRVGAARRWGLPRRHVYVVMVRHPLDRVFSAYGQTQRDKHSVNHGKSLRDFVDACIADSERIPGGNLEFFLTDTDPQDESNTSTVTPSISERFETAAAALQSPNTIVLLHERWEESLQLLGKFGVLPSVARESSRKKHRHRHNKSPLAAATLPLQYGDVAALRKCIHLESRLYEVAVVAFEKQLGSLVD
eukprot:m.211456 g.211456  ORF g.211456 m.211456 type:complete len:338 (-) comp25508_c0_seq1:135-1148(-)